MLRFQFILFFFLILGCTTIERGSARDWILKTNLAHQTAILDNTAFRFQFREYTYGYSKKKNKKTYSRTRSTHEGELTDTLYNDRKFLRWIAGQKIVLSDSLQKVYSESLNSVLYFMQIPKVLNDRAVEAKIEGETTIQGEVYIALKVKFKQEGGGVDYQDEYRYWIHKENHLIDYLAYRFYSGDGGTRFRAVSKRERHRGFVVQDYDNFKPQEKYPLLDKLPLLFEKGELKQVSKIENEAFTYIIQEK